MAASWKSAVISAPGHPSVLTRKVGYLLKKTEEKDSLMALTSASGPTVIDLIFMFKFYSVASQSSGLTYKMQSRLLEHISTECYYEINYSNFYILIF